MLDQRTRAATALGDIEAHVSGTNTGGEKLTLTRRHWHAHTQMNTDLSVVVVLAEKVPVTPPQEPTQLKLLFHAQLKGKSPSLFSYLFIYLFKSHLTFCWRFGRFKVRFDIFAWNDKFQPFCWGARTNKFVHCKLANCLRAEQCSQWEGI